MSESLDFTQNSDFCLKLLNEFLDKILFDFVQKVFLSETFNRKIEKK